MGGIIYSELQLSRQILAVMWTICMCEVTDNIVTVVTHKCIKTWILLLTVAVSITLSIEHIDNHYRPPNIFSDYNKSTGDTSSHLHVNFIKKI